MGGGCAGGRCAGGTEVVADIPRPDGFLLHGRPNGFLARKKDDLSACCSFFAPALSLTIFLCLFVFLDGCQAPWPWAGAIENQDETWSVGRSGR